VCHHSVASSRFMPSRSRTSRPNILCHVIAFEGWVGGAEAGQGGIAVDF
jgi:hypothetical protein